MIDDIEVLIHSCIKISKEKKIYFDPFKINSNYNDADIIFITHDHYDHYSFEDIQKVKKENTIYVIPESMLEKVTSDGIKRENIVTVEPNRKYELEEISFETIPAYNINKRFHPKENNWLGYILEIDGIYYYVAGDTDITEENQKVKCDVAFVPVGGTYTMDYEEAARLVNEINPPIAIPTHYGSIVGNKDDGKKFIELLNHNIKGIIMIDG